MNQSPGWRNPRILSTLLVVFLCGASAGALVMAMGVHRWMHGGSMPTAQAAWKESGKDVTLQRFKRELDLTPAQTEQLETVLDDFFTYYHTLQAQLDDVRASGKQRMMRILDERQKKKFDRLIGEFQDKRLR
ncbi:MAG: hypothetical protein ACM336_11630 [Acidobacteriota bacterium]